MSLSTSSFYAIVEQTRDKIRGSSRLSAAEKDLIDVTGYGHIGDGNVHLNVCIPGYDNTDLQDRLSEVVDGFVFDYVKQARGSVSAEHGVGLQKAQYLTYSKSPALVECMQQIKQVFDPNGIMNPYKVLPDPR